MNVLHFACLHSGYDIVKYLISLNKFDLKQTDIIFKYFIIEIQ